MARILLLVFFFFNDTATTEIYTLSLHDALPIFAYGNNIEKVKEIVIKEIKKIKNLSDEPKPVVRFLEMADSSLIFKAYFYVDSFKYRIFAIDEANTKIYNALNKSKIEIPFPQMDVHLKKK